MSLQPHLLGRQCWDKYINQIHNNTYPLPSATVSSHCTHNVCDKFCKHLCIHIYIYTLEVIELVIEYIQHIFGHYCIPLCKTLRAPDPLKQMKTGPDDTRGRRGRGVRSQQEVKQTHCITLYIYVRKVIKYLLSTFSMSSFTSVCPCVRHSVLHTHSKTRPGRYAEADSR